MKKGLYYSFKILKTAVKRFFVESYADRASALAFTTLLSIVPLLSVFIFLVSIFPVFKKLITLTQNYVFTNFIPTSSDVIRYYLEGFVDRASHLPILGLLSLFIVAGLLIITIENTLNEIWGVSKHHKRLLFWVFFWLMVILAPVLMGMSIFLSSYIFSLIWSHEGRDFFNIKFLMLSVFPFILNTIIFTLIYTVIPNCKVKWRDGLIGGMIAAFLFEIAKKGFALYIYFFPSYEFIYGVLATIPIFLVWLYISWVIILFGALISHTRFLSRGHSC